MSGKLAVPVAASFLACIVVANYVTSTYGFIPVGFGYTATAGTLIAGAAFALRDLLQDVAGKTATMAVIAAGAAVSYLVADPLIATASAAAFLLSEAVDLAVYTPLRKRSRAGDRRWASAVIASNLAGAAVDTVVFLALAFGWAAVLPAFAGQMVGKAWATVMYLLLGWGLGRAVLRQPVHTESA
jgi:uncharacterized PurR-regulated membrane protein YhhQ (DUF165 family)